MADGVEVALDERKQAADGDALVRRHLTAGTATIAGATKKLERNLEAATARAGGGKLARAWGSRSFPQSGPAQNPTGIVYVNGKDRTSGALRYFSETGQNRKPGGGFEAVPLPAAGARGRANNLTPAQWEARTGLKLREVLRPGKAPILVADTAVLGRTGVARGSRARKMGPGRAATVPIFVLIPFQQQRGGVAIQTLVNQALSDLPAQFANAAISG